MSRADVQNLVNLLSNGQAAPTLFGELYDDVMATLGLANWHTTAVPITFTEGQPTVTLPTTLLNLITLIYDDAALSNLTLRELESITDGWRNSNGTPVAYTLETETVKTAAVYPVPYRTSPPIIPVHGLPVGLDYQPGNGVSIHSELRNDPLPILTVPIALRIMEREYDRESPHQDYALSSACKALADLLFSMLR